MPYGNRGYGGGRGYGGQQQSYRGPTQFQTQSFFNPVPVEFMLDQVNQRQTAFDQGYAGAVAGRDILAQEQVGMADLADKNRIIKQGMQDIDSLVQDKYGGDWGRAAKAVAGQVGAIRENPFWNAQKEAEKRREEAREFKIKNPNSFIFNDPTNLSVLDEQGNVREQGAFNVDMAARGDYAETATQIMGLVQADAESFGLSRNQAQGLEHFLQTGSTSGISETKIRELSQDPRLQQLFLGRHGELGRIDELSPEQRQQHGLEGKTAAQFAEEQLYGAGLARVNSKTDLKFLQDSVMADRMKKGGSRSNQAFGRRITNVGEIQNVGNARKQDRIFNRFQGKDITKTDPNSGVALDWEHSGYVMTPNQFKDFQKQKEVAAQRTRDAGGVAAGHNMEMERDQKQYEDLTSLVSNIRKNNPTFKELNDEQLLDEYYGDMTKFKLTFDKLIPIVDEDIAQGLGQQVMGHLQSGVEYQVEGEGTGLVDVTGKDGVTETFNIGPHGIREYLRDEDVQYGYNYDKGMYYVEMPVFDKEQTTYDENAKVNSFKKLYFSPDDDTKLLSNSIQTLEQNIIQGETFETSAPIGRSPEGNIYEMDIKYAGDEGKGQRPVGSDPGTSETVGVTVYEVFPDGTRKVATIDGTIPRQSDMSLNRVKDIITDFQERSLIYYYGERD